MIVVGIRNINFARKHKIRLITEIDKHETTCGVEIRNKPYIYHASDFLHKHIDFPQKSLLTYIFIKIPT